MHRNRSTGVVWFSVQPDKGNCEASKAGVTTQDAANPGARKQSAFISHENGS